MKLNRSLIAVVFSGALILGTPALAVESTWDPPSVEEAAALMERGEFESAIHAWHEIVQAEPDNGRAWFSLGYSLHAAGELEDAIQVHKKAATFGPFEGISLYNLGCAYALTGQTDKAFKALTASSAAGFDVKGSVGGDPDLDSLRNDPRYAMLLDGNPEHSAAGQAPQHRPAPTKASIQAGRERLPQLFQVVAERMEPIMMELTPVFQQKAAIVMQEAMRHGQELMMQLQQRIEGDRELVGAIQEIYQVVQEDPELSTALQQAQVWVQQRMGGAPRGGGMQSAPAAEGGGLRSADVLAEAQRLQQAGDHESAAIAFAALGEMQPDSPAAAFGYAYNLHMDGAYELAIPAHRKAAEFDQVRGISLYNLGCAYAMTGQHEAAFKALVASAEAGFPVADNMASDSDLASIRSHPRFAELQEMISGQ